MSAISGAGPRPGLETGGAEGSGPAAPAAPSDLPDPAVTDFDAARPLERGRADGPLFVDGPSADDPRQGWVGDCYLVASMSALAEARPDLVKGLFRENDDGTVTVRLHDPAAKAGASPAVREVRVDRDIPLHRDAATGELRPRYGGSTGKDAAGAREAWVAVLEKAWAERAGGYGKIEGGNSGAALEALTGAKAVAEIVGDHLTPADHFMAQNLARMFKYEGDPLTLVPSLAEKRRGAAEQSWKFLSEAVSRGDPVVAQTYPEPSVVGRGFLPMHAYTVVGVSERDGQRFVSLRNPAPYLAELAHPDEDMKKAIAARDDYRALGDMLAAQRMGLADLKYGTFEVPLETFRAAFDSAYCVPVGGKR